MGDEPDANAHRRTDTKDPRRARRRAFNVLFQADVRHVAPSVVVEQMHTHPQFRALLNATENDSDTADDALDAFTHALVFGVETKQAELDALIGQFAKQWQVTRMPVVDRTVLRLCVYELAYETTPAAVAINEAVALVKEFSTQKSSKFVNGVLEAIRAHLAQANEDA